MFEKDMVQVYAENKATTEFIVYFTGRSCSHNVCVCTFSIRKYFDCSKIALYAFSVRLISVAVLQASIFQL